MHNYASHFFLTMVNDSKWLKTPEKQTRDQQTDRQTDQPTDIVTYRVALHATKNSIFVHQAS